MNSIFIADSVVVFCHFFSKLNKHKAIILIQSTLISKSKGPSETVRDIRTSTYQIYSIVEKTILTTKFYK